MAEKRLLHDHGFQDPKQVRLSAAHKKGSETEGNKETSLLDCNTSPPRLSVKLPKLRDLPRTSKPWTEAELPIDILLLTVEECEFLSCFFYLCKPFKSYYKDTGYVFFGTMGGGDKSKLKVALMSCSEGSAVPKGSLTVVKNAVRVLRPKAVFSVGSCIGLNSEKAKLGDVIVSSKLTTPVYTTPVSRDIGYIITNVADGWHAPLEKPDEWEVKVHRDGNVLSQSLAASFGWRHEDIIQKYPEAIAVETEGEGVFAAAHDDNVEWVIVKGVASYGDGSHSDAWKSFGSIMAASLVDNILGDHVIFEEWSHCNQDPLYRQLDEKITRTVDKVEELKQELKSQKKKEEPSHVKPFDVEGCRRILAEHYIRTARVRTSAWSTTSTSDINEIYTPSRLSCDEHGSAGLSECELKHYTDLFNAKPNGTVAKRILVQGKTGTGKTTFVKKLAVDWAQLVDGKPGEEQKDALSKLQICDREELHDSNNKETNKDDEGTSSGDYDDISERHALRKFELVLAVNLKEVSKCKSLRDVIRCSNIFAEEDKFLTEDMLSYVTNNQEKVLLILDGYDDYHSATESEIFEIFKGTRLRNCCVLITSRIGKADDLKEFKDLHIQITGFSQEATMAYMRMQLHSEKQAEDLYGHLKEKSLLELAKIPLLLQLFISLWKQGQFESSATTKTTLYKEIVQYVICHSRMKNFPAPFPDVEDYIALLVDFGKVALQGLLKDDYAFEHDELSDATICEDIFNFGIFQVTDFTERQRPTGRTSFIHTSIQEFLAAWYITYSCIPEGNLGPIEKQARTLEDCVDLENCFQFVCGLSDEGAVKVFQHLASIRISDPMLDISKAVPCEESETDEPFSEVTGRHGRFCNLVLDAFEEVKSKAELSRHCFDCFGGTIVITRLLPGLFDLANYLVSSHLASWSFLFVHTLLGFEANLNFKRLHEVFKLLDCLHLPLGVTESGRFLDAGDFLTHFLNVNCDRCCFSSILCSSNSQKYFYITDLELNCNSHAQQFIEYAKLDFESYLVDFKPVRSCLKFLKSLRCYDRLNGEIVKDLGEIIKNCNYMKTITVLDIDDHLCDLLEQVPNPGKCVLEIGSTLWFCTLTSSGAVRLAGLLPSFDKIPTLCLNLSYCCVEAVKTLVNSITHKTIKKLVLRRIRFTPAVATSLGESLGQMPSLEVLEVTGTNASCLQADVLDALFGGFKKSIHLETLVFSCVNLRGRLLAVTKKLCFFPDLRSLELEDLDMDEDDLVDLIQSFRFIPNLDLLSLKGNPLGHAVTAVVPHLSKLSMLRTFDIQRTGFSGQDQEKERMFKEAVEKVLPELRILF